MNRVLVRASLVKMEEPAGRFTKQTATFASAEDCGLVKTVTWVSTIVAQYSFLLRFFLKTVNVSFHLELLKAILLTYSSLFRQPMFAHFRESFPSSIAHLVWTRSNDETTFFLVPETSCLRLNKHNFSKQLTNHSGRKNDQINQGILCLLQHLGPTVRSFLTRICK